MRLNLDSQTIYVVVVVFSLFALFVYGVDLSVNDVTNEDYVGETNVNIDKVNYKRNRTASDEEVINITRNDKIIGDIWDVGPWEIGPWEMPEGKFVWYSYNWSQNKFVQNEFTLWESFTIMGHTTIYEETQWDMQFKMPWYNFNLNLSVIGNKLSSGVLRDYARVSERMNAEGTPWVINVVFMIIGIAVVIMIARAVVIAL